MKVNMNGTVSIADRMAVPQLPKFNAGDYLSNAISNLQNKTSALNNQQKGSKTPRVGAFDN